MTPIKQILYQIQENENKINSEIRITEEGEPLLKDYIQYLKNKTDGAIQNLTLCKTFLLKIAEGEIIPSETRSRIKEFIEDIN